MSNLRKKISKTLLAVIVSSLMGILTAPMASAEIQYDVKPCGDVDLESEHMLLNEFISTNAPIEIDITKVRVVEIYETLPGGSNTSESFMLDAYKGTCCPEGKYPGEDALSTKTINEVEVQYGQCKEPADIYFGTSEHSECTDRSYTCIPIQILVSKSGVGMLKFYALQIYLWGASIVGIIAVLIIVISGVQIAASGGEEQLSTAKTRIMQSLAGIAILFLSGLILYTINPTFFVR